MRCQFASRVFPPGTTLHRRVFSMVEVVLGMGLIAFGLLSVLGLFPVGLTANRDSIAADSAYQFLHLLAARLRDPTGNCTAWTQFGLPLPTSKPSDAEPTNSWTLWYSDPQTPQPAEAWTAHICPASRTRVGLR